MPIKRVRKSVGVLLLLAATQPGSDGDPAGYRFRMPLAVEPGRRVQRLMLPAAVQATLQTRDGRDVRIFDATGRAMPIARGAIAVALRRDSVDPMPILGAPDALKISGVSLRLEGSGAARVAEVRGEAVASDDAPVLLGVLLDTRRIAGRAGRLLADVDLPVGQPVTLLVEASQNLRDWRPLGEATLYRRTAASPSASGIALSGASLDRTYLRIRWRAGSRLLAPVAIRTVTIETRPGGAAAAARIDARVPALSFTPARTIDIAIPFATPVATLRIVPVAADGVVPVRILGRDDGEAPWAALGRGVATSDATRVIALTGDTPRILRIEADARSPGFSVAPRLEIGFGERSIVFMTSGTAPFTLAGGRANASNVFLSRRDLMAGDAALGSARLTAAPVSSIDLASPADIGAARRSLVLWSILLAATALLAGLAWTLWRQDRGRTHTTAT